MALAGAIIQGQRYDAGSYTLSLGGYAPLGVATLSYSDGLESQKLWGIHSEPIGRTRGKYDAEGSIALYKHEAMEWISFLSKLPKPDFTSPPGDGYMEVEFDITVLILSGSKKCNDVLRQCRILRMEDSMPSAGGGDPAQVTFNLSVMKIKRNLLSANAFPLR
jgi:hypothetical protein